MPVLEGRFPVFLFFSLYDCAAVDTHYHGWASSEAFNGYHEFLATPMHCLQISKANLPANLDVEGLEWAQVGLSAVAE